MTNSQPDFTLNLRGVPCPLNFVRTKLKLEQMSEGQLLEVSLDSGEPIEQVPPSLQTEGYTVEEIIDQSDFFLLRVRK